MSKKANPTLIGAFVLVALAVAIAAIMALGRFSFKDDSLHCVAFFSGSMRGLDVGAPVAFRGVSIGRVSRIQLDYDQARNTVVIPVFMELQQQIHTEAGTGSSPERMHDKFQQLIAQGLRAQMRSSSLLTGKQYVELFLNPGSEPVLHGAPSGVLEIPTIASGLDMITEKLENLPLEEILNKLAASLDTLNQAIGSDQAGTAIQALGVSLQRLESILVTIDRHLPGLLDGGKLAMEDLASTMAEARKTLADARQELRPIGSELHGLLQSLQTSVGELNRTLGNLERLSAADSSLNYQLHNTLRELEEAAGSIRELSDYLRQNPNALLFGADKEKP